MADRERDSTAPSAARDDQHDQHTVPGDDVADRLLASARRLLDERGLDAVTVRSVASGADMSTMNVYSRFGGKDGLLDVLYREGFDALGAKLDGIDEASTAEYLRAVADGYRDFAIARPSQYELMFGGEGRGFRPSDDTAARAREVLARVAQRLASDTADDVDPVLVAASLWAMCHGALAFERGSVADSVIDWSAVCDAGVAALIERFFGPVDQASSP